MDDAELAQGFEAMHRNNALAAHENRTRRPYHGEVLECVECGEEIPEGRRAAEPGCDLCVECKQLEEKQSPTRR